MNVSIAGVFPQCKVRRIPVRDCAKSFAKYQTIWENTLHAQVNFPTFSMTNFIRKNYFENCKLWSSVGLETWIHLLSKFFFDYLYCIAPALNWNARFLNTLKVKLFFFAVTYSNYDQWRHTILFRDENGKFRIFQIFNFYRQILKWGTPKMQTQESCSLLY